MNNNNLANHEPQDAAAEQKVTYTKDEINAMMAEVRSEMNQKVNDLREELNS